MSHITKSIRRAASWAATFSIATILLISTVATAADCFTSTAPGVQCAETNCLCVGVPEEHCYGNRLHVVDGVGINTTCTNPSSTGLLGNQQIVGGCGSWKTALNPCYWDAGACMCPFDNPGGWHVVMPVDRWTCKASIYCQGEGEEPGL